MSEKEALEQIYEIVKKVYGECVAVEIVVNSEGIECKTTGKPFTVEYSMRTINGEWLERRDGNA